MLFSDYATPIPPWEEPVAPMVESSSSSGELSSYVTEDVLFKSDLHLISPYNIEKAMSRR